MAASKGLPDCTFSRSIGPATYPVGRICTSRPPDLSLRSSGSNGAPRSSLFALTSTLALGVAIADHHPAGAQTADESEEEAEAAERQAEVAAGLVDTA